MNLSEVARLRLTNQHLTGPACAKPSDVVAALGAVQAQDYPGAKWAVAQRTRGALDADVEQALAEGSIIRTHVLRPTWHFVTPADIRWLLALTATRVNSIMGYYNRELGLDDGVFRRSARALRRALAGGEHLTRAELARLLKRAGIVVAGEGRLGRLLMRAEQDAIVCSGARRGKQFTYALLDERVPAVAAIERDEALLKLTRIYFTTRGPAREIDFAWWSGLTVSDAKRGIDMCGGDLARLSVEGRSFWLAADTVGGRLAPSAHLLPNYDEFSVAYRDRSALSQRLKKSGMETRTDMIFTNIAIINGQLVGTWRRNLAPTGVTVELNPLTQINAAEKKNLRAAATRYGEYLGLTLQYVEENSL